MKGLVTAALISFAALFLFSCATQPSADMEIPGERGSRPDKTVTAAAAERLRRTCKLGLSSEDFPLFTRSDVKMFYHSQAAVLTRQLSLEEKIGQLFIISLWNGEEDDYSLSIGIWEKKQLEYIRPGGVILFGGNIDTEEQTRTLCKDIRDASSIPPFIATDQEGGNIGRLYESGNIPATRIPAPRALGAGGNTDFAFLAGWITGRETASIGVNLVFAPVADVHTDSTHPVIGSRSFGQDPETVARMSTAFAFGMKSAGVIPVLKHFPGHGGAGTDPHLGSAVDRRSLEEFRQSDLLPFIRGIESGIDCIMISHVIVPNITGDDLPASCSPYMSTELLRRELGFRGVSITDSVAMGAIRNRWEAGEAVRNIVKAGVDCILEPFEPRASYQALVDAVREGIISEEEIDISVRRILAMKLEAGIIPWREEWGPNPRYFQADAGLPEYGTILDKYLPGWEELDREGIGNPLHMKINTLLSE